MSRQVTHWLDDENVYADLCGELAALRARVAQPGACDRAAQYVLTAVGEKEKAQLRGGLEAHAEGHEQVEVLDVAVVERVQEVHDRLVPFRAKADLPGAAAAMLLQVRVDRAEIAVNRIRPVAGLGKVDFCGAESSTHVETRAPRPPVAAIGGSRNTIPGRARRWRTSAECRASSPAAPWACPGC